MDLFSLAGKRALITGSTRGLGHAIALEMARAGATVVISSEVPDDCVRVAATFGPQGLSALAIPCDVSDDDALDDLAATVEARLGGVDILVCNAGLNLHNGPSAATPDDAYDRVMAINLRSVFRLCNRIVPAMVARGDGAVILMSSLSGLRGNRGLGVYSMTKAALAQMARNMAVEYGPGNVRVNALSPGLIDTDLSAVFKADPARFEKRMAQTPLRRMGTPREIAGTAVYLASAAGAFVTGHNLVVDGGTLITD
ncbi:SDR family oxidoreductase [Nitrospirillum sp. BR 11163]|uniref:SDR family NAD(P)-dependent oxidoreductase n=1 Tax=Nitrospirillum sp. BR 11163 TaxID=3104323 RepID=UPI002AFF0942|nr:SDR family oxidoreductase [Nitrospirillum sp. BR 11163]MEA1674856.1 SDR family oxidoreductase [Nitrospirillum sp. BR 11163]